MTKKIEEIKEKIEEQILILFRLKFDPTYLKEKYATTKILENMLKQIKLMDYCHQNSLDIPDRECLISYHWEKRCLSSSE